MAAVRSRLRRISAVRAGPLGDVVGGPVTLAARAQACSMQANVPSWTKLNTLTAFMGVWR